MTRDLVRRLLAVGVLGLVHTGSAAPALAGGVHATFYELAVRFFPEDSFLDGSALVGLRESGHAADTIRFWLHGELRVASVRAGGVDLEFAQKSEYYDWDYSLIGNRVLVRLPEGVAPDSIEVAWSGFVHPSKARSPSDYMRIDETGVYLRALGYSPWFPVLLDPDEDEHEVDFRKVSISVPKTFTAVFTGDYLGADDAGDSTRSAWRAEAISLSDAQLTARPLALSIAGDVRVYALADKASLASTKKILTLTRSLLEYYAGHYATGAVSGQVHIVEMPRYGDISSGNVVGIQEDSWRSFDASSWAKRTLAHELVHPFVRPAISRSDPLYALIVEGFPSYFHYPALGSLGELHYPEQIESIRADYLKKHATGKDGRGRMLPEEKAISRVAAEEIGVYKDTFVLSDRALLFLDELRTRMGAGRFDSFNRELFAMDRLDDRTFRALVLRYLPRFETELAIWLDTTELPAALSR